MPNNRKLIVGNWKLNPGTLDEAKKIAHKTRLTVAKLKRTEAVICPPAPFISACAPKKRAPKFSVGVQSVSIYENGAHTGEISAKMVRSVGASFVIAGHSEERENGDTDEIVSKKVARILEAGLIPILCVGEKIRDDSGEYMETLKAQIKNSLAGVTQADGKKIIIAYEPIWAIGAKEAMTPALIHETTIFVRKTFADMFGSDAGLKVKVLYGGAVNYRNASDIITIGKVDGLLVGRESVNATGFVELLKTVDHI